MPNSPSRRIFLSCAARRIRRKWWRAADELGLAAIGIADRNSFAGVVRAYDEARKRKIKLLVGTRLVTIDGFEAIAYPTDRQGLRAALPASDHRQSQGREGRMPSRLRRHFGGKRGTDFYCAAAARCRCSANSEQTNAFTRTARNISPPAPRRTFLAGIHYHRGDEPRRLGLLAELGERIGAPLVAVNDVLYHAPERRPLADMRHLRARKMHARRSRLRNSPSMPSATSNRRKKWRGCSKIFPTPIARTIEIAQACRFSLDQLKYEYPDEPVPPGKTAQQHLTDLTWAGAAQALSQGAFSGRHSSRGRQAAERRTGADRRAQLRALFSHRA